MDITALLGAAADGDDDAKSSLFSALRDELRRLAEQAMWGERASHTLQPTALVGEAYLKLFGSGPCTFKSRVHFLGAAASAMKQVLVDYARRRRAKKRGGDADIVPLPEEDTVPAAGSAPDTNAAVLELQERLALAVDELERKHPERARVFIDRFWGGMTNEEAAVANNLSVDMVRRHWTMAKQALEPWLWPWQHS